MEHVSITYEKRRQLQQLIMIRAIVINYMN